MEETKTINCGVASGEKLKNHLPEQECRKLLTLTEPGQNIQIDFSMKIINKKLNGDPKFNSR